VDLTQELNHPFVVRDFTGPLDLLLHLIRTNEMNIADIPIVPLVEQYQRYLDMLEELNLTVASEYLHMLAILLSIKARMLLPRTEEEKADPETDPRRDLIAQLLDYEKIKAAADDLHERFSLWSGVLGRPEPEDEAVLGEVSLYDLVEAFHKVLKARKDREGPAFLPLPRPQVKDLMAHILAFVPRSGKPFPLLDILLQLKNSMEVITAFLATLELCRLGCVRLQQKEPGADISLVYLKEIPTDLTFIEYL
jgi:segregation and condensation protein A